MIGPRRAHARSAPTSSSSVDHELSGNIIDLCPVGALNTKPFRFTRARLGDDRSTRWCRRTTRVGTNLFGHVLRGQLMRVVPRENEAINETWIADRDRFSYEGVYSADRLQRPLVRAAAASGCETDWETALGCSAAEGLRGACAASSACSPAAPSTLEELYLLTRLARGLGSAQHRSSPAPARFPRPGRRPGAPGPRHAHRGRSTRSSAAASIGSNLRREVPMLAHRVRKAARRGAQVSLPEPGALRVPVPGRGLPGVGAGRSWSAISPRCSPRPRS